MAEQQLPEGWELIALEQLGAHVIGGDWGQEPNYPDEGYSNVYCIRGTEFKTWRQEKGATAVSRKVKNSSLETRKLKIGDILIEISGGGPEQPVGRTVLIDKDVISKFSAPIVCTNFLRLFRPTESVDSKFLIRYLEKFYLSGEISTYQGGSNNLRNLKFKEYSAISIPLPPLAEQQAIADTLDRLLAQVERSKARLQRIPQLLKRFRQSVLAAAVSGKLTEEWRGVNIKALSSAEGLEEKVYQDEKVIPIPECWEWTRLGHLAKLVNGDRGENYPNRSEFLDSGEPFINAGHISDDFTLKTSDMNYISRKKYETLRSGKIIDGDIVYCLRGTTGKIARVHPYSRGAIASSLIIIRPLPPLNADYIIFALASPYGKSLISRFDNGTAQPNLSAKSLSSYPIPLPTSEEQAEIVRRVEQLFAYANRIEQQAQAALARVNHLTQAILAKAFRGELTEQWRRDNPHLISGDHSATALLARIQAERAKAPAKGRGRKSNQSQQG